MKILLTIQDISATGGAERVVVNFANALSELGHEVEVMSFYQKNTNLPYALATSIKLWFKNNYTATQKSTQTPKKHFSHTKNAISRRLLSYKLNTMGYDIIIANDALFFPYFKNKHTKYIKICHESSLFGSRTKRDMMFDIFVVLSTKEIDTWQRYHQNVRVIPNFIPKIPTQCTNHAQKVVLSVGRFSSEKGFLRLIDIWHIVAQDKGFTDKKWRLVIVGDGPLKSEIESKIKSLNLQDSIILKPFTKEIEREYLGASIYAMASHFEGFPMVLVEACSYALPCIAFDIATGPSDIIVHNKSGYLVSDNDLETYAKHLITLMSDESKRIAFGGKAKRLVGERFSKEVVMKMWENLLGESNKSMI